MAAAPAPHRMLEATIIAGSAIACKGCISPAAVGGSELHGTLQGMNSRGNRHEYPADGGWEVVVGELQVRRELRSACLPRG